MYVHYRLRLSDQGNSSDNYVESRQLNEIENFEATPVEKGMTEVTERKISFEQNSTATSETSYLRSNHRQSQTFRFESNQLSE